MSWEDRAVERMEKIMEEANAEGQRMLAQGFRDALVILCEEWGAELRVADNELTKGDLFVTLPGAEDCVRMTVAAMEDGWRLISSVDWDEKTLDELPWWKWQEILQRVGQHIMAPIANGIDPGDRLAARAIR